MTAKQIRRKMSLKGFKAFHRADTQETFDPYSISDCPVARYVRSLDPSINYVTCGYSKVTTSIHPFDDFEVPDWAKAFQTRAFRSHRKGRSDLLNILKSLKYGQGIYA